MIVPDIAVTRPVLVKEIDRFETVGQISQDIRKIFIEVLLVALLDAVQICEDSFAAYKVYDSDSIFFGIHDSVTLHEAVIASCYV